MKKTDKLNSSAYSLERLEFHRHGLALMPDIDDKRPEVAFFLKGSGNEPDLRMCSCSLSKRQTCHHILELIELYRVLKLELGGTPPQEAFRSSIWYDLAAVMADRSREIPGSVSCRFTDAESGKILKIADSGGEDMVWYGSQSAHSVRFLERLGQGTENPGSRTRSAVLEHMCRLTLTHDERIMSRKGFKTYQQTLEESFWYRFAYHGFREFGSAGNTFHPAIEESTQKFMLTFRHSGKPVFYIFVPAGKIKRLLNALKETLSNLHGLKILPIPLNPILKVSVNTDRDLEIKPMVQVVKENGEVKLFERGELENFRYGDLIYIKEEGLLAELEHPEKTGRKPIVSKMVIDKAGVPDFLQEHADELFQSQNIVDATVKNLKIYDKFHEIEITPDALDRDWCWLSLRYGFGNLSVSLVEILRAKREGRRFVDTQDGWVDCQSQDFDALDSVLSSLPEEEASDKSGRLKLSRMELLRLKVSTSRPLKITGTNQAARLLDRMFELKPERRQLKLQGLTSTLRPYQKLGMEWLLFLYENGFGGLLCDDMGLGKTHQVMAFMLALREHYDIRDPFLVVCPATVLSHWRDKILAHAPGLKAAVFHGGQRNLGEMLEDNKVLLTSYGIIRNDIEQLQRIPFALAVFDEIQNMKNPQTLAHEAAVNINAKMKIGLTGTPIENRIGELKALFDLTIPGYLGTDEHFNMCYVKPIETDSAGARRTMLSRTISPFTLRRLKSTVLTELPEKIEDIRTCDLSDDQIKLYRDAIASKGRKLLSILEKGEKPVPYMHVFALLTLLKQICDHPALVEGKPGDFERYQSGKWELFKELLSEGLDAGQKIVVFSQFLGMIQIMEMFLRERGVGFATLTGATRKRGDVIARFNNDPDCRVFVGSLKAGGVGIDLVAGSIVIHYDRWWNAAKEDQATDRVHRMGQRRGVQVFKLVTQGTLEEKVSAIIERKRQLMDSIVGEDDPGLLKIFSKEELLEMLSVPGVSGGTSTRYCPEV